MERALIIFVKNPAYGKVKTRLAATLGHEKALEIYRLLLTYTCKLSSPLPYDKYVYYADHVDRNDLWSNEVFIKRRQEGHDLGNKMMHAFREVFSQGHQRVLIIGSDCMELTATILERAYSALENHAAVIGPAADGGYYLLGLNTLHVPLFENIPWSTDQVLDQTLAVCRGLGLSYYLLPELHDIDQEADWIKALHNDTLKLFTE